MKTDLLTSQRAASPRYVVRVRFVAFFRSAWRRLRRWQRLSYERRLLASLSQGQLKDIGISRADALNEARRPFWDDKA